MRRGGARNTVHFVASQDTDTWQAEVVDKKKKRVSIYLTSGAKMEVKGC